MARSGALSLSLGATIALAFKPRNLIVGLVLAFGAGALISAVAYELVLDALDLGNGTELAVGLALGALTFYFGDLWIDRRGGKNRKGMEGKEGEGNALALFLGALLDGVPESLILGMSVSQGEVGLAFLAAVFVSNVPEGMAATSGFQRAGWPPLKIHAMWLGVVAVSALASTIGYALFQDMTSVAGAYVQGFAAGALLTMLADTMMPEAYKEAGPFAGLATTLGFAIAVGISTLE